MLAKNIPLTIKLIQNREGVLYSAYCCCIKGQECL